MNRMLKHCSLSSKDVSRQSLRQSSLTIASDQSVSSDCSDQFYLYTDQSSQEGDSETDTLATVTGEQDRAVRGEREDQDDTGAKNDDESDRSSEVISLPATIRVYTTCLRPHMSYKTVRLTPDTTSKQVIMGLLSRLRMKHTDPRLFYLTMEVTVNQFSPQRDDLLQPMGWL